MKTSTGFAGGGATAEHVALMRASVGPSVQVKASGGVRDLDTVLALHELGATRFGTSATAVILEGAAARAAGDRRGSAPTRPSDTVVARTDGASY
ncbi:hypothetical protein ACQP04_15805 [Pseudonocardia halophobica]|uniref:hypothetical protein n=1 Tax=Pseudonocardia halophobica TaxID=29401 RepID=UPI003D912E77